MIPRTYKVVAKQHFGSHRQMMFVSGPRQVGKTTLCQILQRSYEHASYFSWDDIQDRKAMLEGPDKIAKLAGLEKLRQNQTFVALDEFHKSPDWKDYLKSFFDSYGDKADIFVSGSGKLDVFRSGGESLMGRYFTYRMHPLSVGELVNSGELNGFITAPTKISEDRFSDLIQYGGFPEPFSKATDDFYNRWRNLRTDQLLREEVGNLTGIRHIDRLEVLAELIRTRTGQLLNYSSLANDVKVSVDTIRRWLDTLRALYYCFRIRPWYRNVARSLRKQPKFYLWDWSTVSDKGLKYENIVASALLKAVHQWEDRGLGECGLFFLRDKEKREVDFVVVREGSPWFIVEVKNGSNNSLSPHLEYFQNEVDANHAFQVVFSNDYVPKDCFDETDPMIVPAKTFLSQLP